MDTATHALLGVLAGQAASPRQGRLTNRERIVLAGSVAAFPDVDFLGFPIDPLTFLADWHQGLTHSVVLMPLWACCAAGLFMLVTGRRGVFTEAVLLSMLSLASHILLDVITAYGTQLFAPFSDRRFALGLVFVIDPLFTAIVVLSLALALHMPRRQLCFTRLGIIAICGYVLIAALLKQQALDVATDFAKEQRMGTAESAVFPQPFSPFNWTLLVREEDMYFRAQLNLAGHRPWLPDVPGLRWLHEVASYYKSSTDLGWERHYRYGERKEERRLARRLWQRDDFSAYRRFAVYPSLSRVERRGGETCVWFTDLRYDLPGLPDTFRYGFCRSGPEQPWERYRLRYFSENDRQAV